MASQVRQANRRASSKQAATMRAHDYLYDPSFIVNNAKDFARAQFKAAMATAEVSIVPNYPTMFSDLGRFPRQRVVYHGNARLPNHVDLTYEGAVQRANTTKAKQLPDYRGAQSYQFYAAPNQVPEMTAARLVDDASRVTFKEPTRGGKSRSRGVQTVFRESSAQTAPWQPKISSAQKFKQTPEVTLMDDMLWGAHNDQYKVGDLPVDYHTTAIINKRRLAEAWLRQLPPGCRRRDFGGEEGHGAILEAIELNDFAFRDAEIDEMQRLRLAVWRRAARDFDETRASAAAEKLSRLYDRCRAQAASKIRAHRHSSDRELRKLRARHAKPRQEAESRETGRRAPRALAELADCASEPYAPLMRNGRRPRFSHEHIEPRPQYAALYDGVENYDTLPRWLERFARFSMTPTGEKRPISKRTPGTLCPRLTRFTDDSLQRLHEDLKKMRVGVTRTGPCPLMTRRDELVARRLSTPRSDSVDQRAEDEHQAALVLQRSLRGRAVQCAIYEGRYGCGELITELKATHGVLEHERAAVRAGFRWARDTAAKYKENVYKEEALEGVVDGLQGETLGAALDFLDKELRRLKEERRLHAAVMVAYRERVLREAAEAGRRQKEERRRREHDELFKQMMHVSQDTVDEFLRQACDRATDADADREAQMVTQMLADVTDQRAEEQKRRDDPYEEWHLVADLVNHFVLPEARRKLARRDMELRQERFLKTAREAIWGTIESLVDPAQDEAEIQSAEIRFAEDGDLVCARICRTLREDQPCVCHPRCPHGAHGRPAEVPRHSDDKRWQLIKRPPQPPRDNSLPPETLRPFAVRPCPHDVIDISECKKCTPSKAAAEPGIYTRELVNRIIDEVVDQIDEKNADLDSECRKERQQLKEREKTSHFMRQYVLRAVNRVCDGQRSYAPRVRQPDYRYYMLKKMPDMYRGTTPRTAKPGDVEKHWMWRPPERSHDILGRDVAKVGDGLDGYEAATEGGATIQDIEEVTEETTAVPELDPSKTVIDSDHDDDGSTLG